MLTLVSPGFMKSSCFIALDSLLLSPLLVNHWVWSSLPGHCCPTASSLRQFTFSEMVPLSLLKWGLLWSSTKLCSVCLLNRTLPSQIIPSIVLCPVLSKLLMFAISLYLFHCYKLHCYHYFYFYPVDTFYQFISNCQFWFLFIYLNFYFPEGFYQQSPESF